MAEDILERIAGAACKRVDQQKGEISLEQMAERAEALAQAELQQNGVAGIVDEQGAPRFTYPFKQACDSGGLAFICEVKKASPSKGVIADDFPYVDIAQQYEAAGASAISCLTEPEWFLGKDEYLEEIVSTVSIPVLRKDFVVDEYMIYQAKCLGASAVLLIVSLLSDQQLSTFGTLAQKLGMSALVEAHTEVEVNRALATNAAIIGVNNRNLRDFSVDFQNAQLLRELIPFSVTYVAESGVSTPEDVERIARTGADAVLVGEALMRSPNIAETLASFKQAALSAYGGAFGGQELQGMGTARGIFDIPLGAM